MIDYEAKILARQEAIELAEDATCLWDCDCCEYARIVYQPDIYGNIIECYECSLLTEDKHKC